jgi:hypothetical protein
VLELVLEFGYILQAFVAGGGSACVAGAGEDGMCRPRREEAFKETVDGEPCQD